jgi:hypothetical protein
VCGILLVCEATRLSSAKHQKGWSRKNWLFLKDQLNEYEGSQFKIQAVRQVSGAIVEQQ